MAILLQGCKGDRSMCIYQWTCILIFFTSHSVCGPNMLSAAMLWLSCLYLFLQCVSFAVDGLKKCEKWERQDIVESRETKTSSWFNRFIGRAKKPEMTWPFPFSEGKMFVLTIQAGVEGYHINVGGRHVASFSHRMVYQFPCQCIYSIPKI